MQTSIVFPASVHDKTEFTLSGGTFRLTKSRPGLYCLKHLERPDHARFGNRQEIESDIAHAELCGTLPRPKVWGF